MLIILGVVVSLILYTERKINSVMHYNEDCYGIVNYELISDTESYAYSFSHNIYISDHGTGYNSIKGTMTVKGEIYIINRTVNYDYNNLDNGRVRINPKSTNKSMQDNLPDSVAEKYLPYILSGNVYYIKMERIGSQKVLFSGNNGKILICTYK